MTKCLENRTNSIHLNMHPKITFVAASNILDYNLLMKGHRYQQFPVMVDVYFRFKVKFPAQGVLSEVVILLIWRTRLGHNLAASTFPVCLH